MKPEFALSVKQPFAEAILAGKKKHEYRSVPTRRLNERVYIYASQRPRDTPISRSGEFTPTRHEEFSLARSKSRTAQERLATGLGTSPSQSA